MASGRLMRTDAAKPPRTVPSVDRVWCSTVGQTEAVAVQMALGAGNRNSRMPKKRTAPSQTPNRAITASQAGREARRRRSASGRAGRALAEDAVADAAGATVEVL